MELEEKGKSSKVTRVTINCSLT